MNEPQNVEGSKYNAVIKSLIISIGGHFLVFLIFAVSYTVSRVFGDGKVDLSAEDPGRAVLMMICLFTGMLFPLLAGFYCGKKNMNIKTYSHYILGAATGSYVFYISEGQTTLIMNVFLSLFSIGVIFFGFHLSKIKRIKS